MENNMGFVQQGWQCPICHAVMSPTTDVCVNCTGITITTTNTIDINTDTIKASSLEDILDYALRCREDKSNDLPQV